MIRLVRGGSVPNFFHVEVRQSTGWHTIDDCRMNRCSQARNVARSIAYGQKVATRVVNGNGRVKMEFMANGQRKKRR